MQYFEVSNLLAASIWRTDGHGFDPRGTAKHSFAEINNSLPTADSSVLAKGHNDSLNGNW